jgi:small subunit ribosomal protein S16
MPAKIRLSRRGKKGHAYYHIVIADQRASRDGKFIEKIGSYDPNTNPATIVLNVDKAHAWLKKGAQPTDTMRAILSYKGVLLKDHLERGVKKGALTEEQASEKFNNWVAEKDGKIAEKKNRLVSSKAKDIEKRLEAESKINEAKANQVAKKRAAAQAKPVAEGEGNEGGEGNEVPAEVNPLETFSKEGTAETPTTEENPS